MNTGIVRIVVGIGDDCAHIKAVEDIVIYGIDSASEDFNTNRCQFRLQTGVLFLYFDDRDHPTLSAHSYGRKYENTRQAYDLATSK